MPENNETPKLSIVDEYREAGALFRDGFSTIANIIRTFLILNGILITALGITLRLGNEVDALPLQVAICVIGFLAPLVTWVVHRRMTIYFRSWVQRAGEIEKSATYTVFEKNGKERQYDFNLYKSTSDIESTSRGNLLQTYALMNLTYFLCSCAWVAAIFWICFGVSTGALPSEG